MYTTQLKDKSRTTSQGLGQG